MLSYYQGLLITFLSYAILKIGEKNMTILNKFEDFFKQFMIIILYIMLIVLLQAIFYKDLNNSSLIIQNLVNILIYLIMLIVFLIIFRKKIIPDFYDFKKNGKKYIKDTYYYWLIGLVIMLVSNLIISSFIGMPQNEESNRELLSKLPVYSIMSVLVFAPIIEELMTRVILKDTFKHPYIYIVLSGLIFGSLHIISSNNIYELFYIIPYGVLGCAFAKIYYETNNVWSNIFFHSFHNLISVLIIFLGV